MTEAQRKERFEALSKPKKAVFEIKPKSKNATTEPTQIAAADKADSDDGLALALVPVISYSKI